MIDLCNISELKKLLDRFGFQFSKALGQNFIVNPGVCPRIAEESGITERSGVIEIGPGFGVLTQQLALRAKKVVCIELDERLPGVLAVTLHGLDNVEVVTGDVLKTDLNALIAEKFADCEDVHVCANLPYYITSPVIMALLESRLPVKAITVMVQKEAAERMCAPVGSRDSGAVTVAVNYYAEAKKLFEVSAGSFMPAPKVDSAVMRLTVREQPPVAVKDEAFFFKTVRAAFGQRRKTASNSVSAGLGIGKAVVGEALERCGFAPAVRAESMTMEELAQLSDTLLTLISEKQA